LSKERPKADGLGEDFRPNFISLMSIGLSKKAMFAVLS